VVVVEMYWMCGFGVVLDCYFYEVVDVDYVYWGVWIEFVVY